MRKRIDRKNRTVSLPAGGWKTASLAILLCLCLVGQGCFDPVYPQRDREERVMEAISLMENRPAPPTPLTASSAVRYALENNLDAKVVEIEMAYYNEAAVAARRRLLPSLNLRYSFDHSSHPDARWYEDAKTGGRAMDTSFNADPNYRRGEVGLMWNVLDFGVGYLRARQQDEKMRQSAENYRRIRQQIALDVLTHYWRTSAAIKVACEADALRREIESQADTIRGAVGAGALNATEGARRELALHAALADLEQWSRVATQARLDLGRVLGCGNALDFSLEEFPEDTPEMPPIPGGDPAALQTAALQRRPELFQQDSQERIALDDARLALLQMAPNATLSMGLYGDPDKFLEWNNWMTVGAKVSWNLFNIPARLAEKRAANLQGELARQKGLALAAAIMAQVGLAFSEWKLSYDNAAGLSRKAEARSRLVDALAQGEGEGAARPGEVLEERVRLLGERAAALRALAEARVSAARLANAVGLDVDGQGRLLWNLAGAEVDLLKSKPSGKKAVAVAERVRQDDLRAAAMMPPTMSGLKVVMAEDFEAPAEYFFEHSETVVLGGDPEPRQERKEDAVGEKADSGAVDIASINEWANRTVDADFNSAEGGAGGALPEPGTVVGPGSGETRDPSSKPALRGGGSPRKKAEPRPGRAMAQSAEKGDGKSDPAERLLRADEMRRLYSEKKHEPRRSRIPESGPERLGEIPALTVLDFVGTETRSLMDPKAWRTMGEDEIRELASMGLTDPRSEEWNRPAVRRVDGPQTDATFSGGPGAMGLSGVNPVNQVRLGLSGAKLTPVAGGSLRPPGKGKDDDGELRRALSPLESLTSAEPAASPSSAGSLRPPKP